MNKKMKEYFTPHVLMHSLFGLGLGIVLTSLIPAVQSVWLGVALIVIALVLDMMRKD